MNFSFNFLKTTLTSVVVALVCSVSFSTFAESPAKSEEGVIKDRSDAPVSTSELQKKLMGKLGVLVKEVNETPMKGLYEAVVGDEILYTDENVDFIVMGQLFDAKTQRNLTAETKERLNRINFTDLPLEDAIKTVNGNGKREIAVFSDPYCGFCKKLETSLKEMKDVTIYTFLYPVIRPDSRLLSENIWCSKDRSAAWQAQMIGGVAPAQKDPSCDTSALDRNINLGNRLQVTGTPTIFVPSGQRAPGAVGIEYLENMLAQQPAH